MRLSLLLLGLLLALVTPHATAQPCTHGVASGVLNANEVKASVFNTGALFFGGGTTSGNGYLVPAAFNLSPIFAADLWVGGTVEGELRVAAARYTRFEFWPGPLSETGEPPADCAAYDRIYVVSRADIVHYETTGTARPDLADWPFDLGAPVRDGDGDPGNYNLPGGDRPEILGDQMAWWVMNDAGGPHEETGSDPIGLEVRVSAFAAASSSAALNHATFYRYELVYRGSAPLDSAYVGFFVDADLGDASDDRVGSDTTLGLGFTYNGDDFDDPSSGGYGIPPAVGLAVLHGPVGLPNGRDDDGDGAVDEAGERLGMTAFACPWKNGPPPLNDPRTASDYYACLQGLHKSGEAVTAAGDGYLDGGPVTPYYFAGDPVEGACWSMANDCTGGSQAPNDMRMTVATGPFRMEPGWTQTVVIAVPFAQGGDHLDSLSRLRAATAALHAYASPLPVDEPPAPTVSGALRAYPNPFADHLTVVYALDRPEPVRVTVLNVLGQVVARATPEGQGRGTHTWTWAPDGVPPGLYVVRLEGGTQTRTVSVVRTR